MALSASTVIAAPSPKAASGITKSGDCGPAAVTTEVRAVKPAKNEQKQNKGKHLGQTKHENKPADESEVETGHERKQNHGWFVSQAAHDDAFVGSDHGKHVSEVARSDAGKPAKADR